MSGWNGREKAFGACCPECGSELTYGQIKMTTVNGHPGVLAQAGCLYDECPMHEFGKVFVVEATFKGNDWHIKLDLAEEEEAQRTRLRTASGEMIH